MTDQRIIDTLKDWAAPPEAMPALALNLTHPHNTPDPVRIKQVKKFQSVTNRLAFGNAAKPLRGNKKLYFFLMTEKGFDHHETYMHHHGILEVPTQFTVDEWREVCMRAWLRISGGNRMSQCITELDGPAFLNYMLKRRDKQIYTDAIRLEAINPKSEFYKH